MSWENGLEITKDRPERCFLGRNGLEITKHRQNGTHRSEKGSDLLWKPQVRSALTFKGRKTDVSSFSSHLGVRTPGRPRR